MIALLRKLFGTPTRRLVSLIVSNAVFYAAAFGIHYYIDEVAASPAFSFGLVFTWMALGAINGFFTIVALGNIVLYPGHTEDFLRDEMAEMDARIDGRAPEETAADDAAVLRRGDGGFRFGIYFVCFAAVHILVTNSLSGSFLSRYTHPGVAVVHMRNDDPAIRRAGLNMLTERLDFKATPAVAAVVLRALEDPDEGVAARATFVAGMLNIQGAVPQLAALARSNEALTFSTLIAIGQVGGRDAVKAARELADDPVARKEPKALAYMIGLVRARAIERLRQIYTDADDDETRVAAIWAIGRLREARLLPFVSTALAEGSLGVRCAAATALGEMVTLDTVFETSAALRAAFEASSDPLERCPEILLPVQEGGTKVPIVGYRVYQLNLVQALATTDDPTLLTWLVKHQEGVESRTHEMMRLLYEKLKEKDARGALNGLKRTAAERRLKARMEAGDSPADAGPSADGGPDAGAPAP